MKRTVACSKCGAVCEYDNKSVCEGNRDFENVHCPKCGQLLDRVFTDSIPTVRLVKKGDEER